ncbi:hypothetical protein P20480_3684 [Pseudoalteromonas sp. BSi20480]|nr:hypothetical protein [Pseudoalteromonas sp. BSi20480]GAA77191.1 hypothetical protein P20480_3684 [Pseudoalteromonas sp. BSi20480]
MIEQAYDQKNSDNFEANTKSIKCALEKIKSNKKLKATVTQIAEMTGMHRNAISNRGWPVTELKKIKDSRKLKKHKEEKLERENANDTKVALEQSLHLTREEVVYWFNEYQNMKRFFEHSDKRFQKMRESRDHYKELYERERKSLLESEQEVERLKELLELR